MSSITLLGDTSGSIVIDAPAIAGNGTLTLPRGTATLAFDGPAFSAFLNNSNQSVSNATNTKVNLNSEEFDTASCFDTSNGRFTPNVAGYYQFNWQLSVRSATNIIRFASYVWKNGSPNAPSKNGGDIYNGNAQNGYKIGGSALLYANGTTDYFELYGYVETSSGTNVFNTNGGVDTYLQGFLARAA